MILSVTSEKQTPSFTLFALCLSNADAAVSDSLRPLKGQIFKSQTPNIISAFFPFFVSESIF